MPSAASWHAASALRVASETCIADFGRIATRHYHVSAALALYDRVAGHLELLQADMDHPNAANEAVIVKNMLSAVEILLERVRIQLPYENVV
jgi:hypothetical protein